MIAIVVRARPRSRPQTTSQHDSTSKLKQNDTNETQWKCEAVGRERSEATRPQAT